jgi:hypothetical protein
MDCEGPSRPDISLVTLASLIMTAFYPGLLIARKLFNKKKYLAL